MGGHVKRVHELSPEELVKRRAYKRAFYYANKDKSAAWRKSWYLANREYCIKHAADYSLANRENIKKRRVEMKASTKDARANPHRVRSAKHCFRARRRGLLHTDHDTRLEIFLHIEAIRLTKETGIVHTVDHIIPMASGGWHHHLNLHVVPYSVNFSKGSNPIWEKPGYKSWRDVPEFLWPDGLRLAYQALKTVPIMTPDIPRCLI